MYKLINKIGRTDKKKLSWIYRKKTKLQKSNESIQNITDNIDENKKPRIIVRNIPFKVMHFSLNNKIV